MSPPVPAVQWGEVGSTLQSFLTAFAIVVGGVWTYLGFYRSRTKAWLEIDGHRLSSDHDLSDVLITVTMKNEGSSAFDMAAAAGSAVLLSASDDVPGHTVGWTRIDATVVDLFDIHTHIGPGEAISEEQLFKQVPMDQPVKATARVIVGVHTVRSFFIDRWYVRMFFRASDRDPPRGLDGLGFNAEVILHPAAQAAVTDAAR